MRAFTPLVLTTAPPVAMPALNKVSVTASTSNKKAAAGDPRQLPRVAADHRSQGGLIMRHRHLLTGAAAGLFVAVAIAAVPAAASPCTDLQSLQLKHTVITSAQDNTTGVFVVPNTNPPQTIAGLPSFCRVTATLIPTSDSAIKIEVWLPETTWNGRFLGTGGGGFQGRTPT